MCEIANTKTIMEINNVNVSIFKEDSVLITGSINKTENKEQIVGYIGILKKFSTKTKEIFRKEISTDRDFKLTLNKKRITSFFPKKTLLIIRYESKKQEYIGEYMLEIENLNFLNWEHIIIVFIVFLIVITLLIFFKKKKGVKEKTKVKKTIKDQKKKQKSITSQTNKDEVFDVEKINIKEKIFSLWKKILSEIDIESVQTEMHVYKKIIKEYPNLKENLRLLTLSVLWYKYSNQKSGLLNYNDINRRDLIEKLRELESDLT